MIDNRFKNEKKSVEQLIREYRRDMRKCDKYQLPQPTTHYVRILLGRVEAACRRAYNEIDDAVCATEDISSLDIDYIRRHIEQTIGDYYE